MLNISKIKTYLGFAIKSGKIIYGYDNLLVAKHKPKLVISCSSLNKKMFDKVNNYCKLNNIMISNLNEILLSDLTNKNNCKVVGIVDENLSKALINEFKMEN